MIEDIRRNVTTTYRANTREQEAGVQRLGNAQRGLAAEEKKGSDARKKANDDWMGQLAKAGLSMEAIKKSVELANKGLEAYAKTSAEASAKVEHFRKTAEAAFTKVLAAVGEMVVKMQPLLDAVGRLVSFLSDIGVIGPAAIGALALALTKNPAIAAFVAAMSIAEVTSLKGSGLDPHNLFGTLKVLQPRPVVATTSASDTEGIAKRFADQFGAVIEQGVRRGLGVSEWDKFEFQKAEKGDGGLAAGRRGAHFALDTSRQIEGSNVRSGAYGDLGLGSRASENVDSLGIQRDPVGSVLAGYRGLLTLDQEIESRAAAQRMNYLERTFGPIEQFDAYAKGFQLLEGAITTSMNAWIDGTGGAGVALQQFLASIAKSFAIEAAINVAKSLAMAATYAATPGMQFWVPGALKSAAAWGLVAVAAGAGARALGGGSGAPSGGPSGASGGGPSAPQSYASGSQAPVGQAIVVVGDAFSYDSPRNRQANARRFAELAIGTRGVVYE